MSNETHIKFDHAGVEFTIYQTSARLLKKKLLQTAVGGFIRTSEKHQVVVQALEDINLEIRSGERVALLGHNGAGKTTLLRAMGGIFTPTSGTADIVGRRMPLFELGLGLDEEASGYENILLRGLVVGLRRADIEKRMDEIAAFSGLGDFLNLPIRTYSSGMMLRLLFSIATSVDADILLMDEWLGTGDQEFVAKANARLLDLVDRSHILVLASHEMHLVEQMCTRGIVLESGRIVFDGPISSAIAAYSGGKPA